MAARWAHGYWVGRCGVSDSHLVLSLSSQAGLKGVVRVDAVKRVSGDRFRFAKEAFDRMLAIPIDPSLAPVNYGIPENALSSSLL